MEVSIHARYLQCVIISIAALLAEDPIRGLCHPVLCVAPLVALAQLGKRHLLLLIINERELGGKVAGLARGPGDRVVACPRDRRFQPQEETFEGGMQAAEAETPRMPEECRDGPGHIREMQGKALFF